MKMSPAKKHMRQGNGPQSAFTLIEVLVVLAIICILATIALPSKTGQVVRRQVKEGTQLTTNYRAPIEAFYHLTGQFPSNNKAAALPEPDKIIGHYVSSVVLEDGAMHISYGNKANKAIAGKTVSIRPLYVKESPLSPISWVCGLDTIPDGMLAAGANKTNVELRNLPLTCR